MSRYCILTLTKFDKEDELLIIAIRLKGHDKVYK